PTSIPPSAHAPSSPVFPYSTLFRSVFVSVAIATSARRAIPGIRFPERKHFRELAFDHDLIRRFDAQTKDARRRNRLGPGPPRGPDRKSTRLNSSHVKISYAVLCLKK